MNRTQLQTFIADLSKLRENISDEIALSAPAIYPQWSGEGVQYALGQRVLYNDTLYRVLIAHTSQSDWNPGATPGLFAKILIPDVNVIPEWEQPSSTNPYAAGDKVKHNGYVWISTIDGNVWEPGVYGWEKEENK